MEFTLGRFRVRFLGTEEMIGRLKIKAERYLSPDGAAEPDATVRFEELQFLPPIRCADGWNTCVYGGENTIVCVRNHRPLFAFRYQPGEKSMTVYVKSDQYSSVQYAANCAIMIALHRQCVGLHGVTLLCGNEIVILSAPSGTGKTTLANLLETYCGAITVNGDFALLSPTPEGVIFEPTFFCGTSGRCLNHRFRVSRVVFLEQSKSNEWRALNGREAVTSFIRNTFLPGWDDGMMRSVQQNIMNCVSNVDTNVFAFAPVREAAEMFFGNIRS